MQSTLSLIVSQCLSFSSNEFGFSLQIYPLMHFKYRLENATIVLLFIDLFHVIYGYVEGYTIIQPHPNFEE